MFFVLNKQKIYSYVVAAGTIAVLFLFSFFFIDSDMKIKETSTNVLDNIIETKYTNDIKNSHNQK